MIDPATFRNHRGYIDPKKLPELGFEDLHDLLVYEFNEYIKLKKYFDRYPSETGRQNTARVIRNIRNISSSMHDIIAKYKLRFKTGNYSRSPVGRSKKT